MRPPVHTHDHDDGVTSRQGSDANWSPNPFRSGGGDNGRSKVITRWETTQMGSLDPLSRRLITSREMSSGLGGSRYHVAPSGWMSHRR